MTEFEKLVMLEQFGFYNIEFQHQETLEYGVCCVAAKDNTKVALWWGAEDGSDDKWISAEEFSSNFRIISCFVEDY